MDYKVDREVERMVIYKDSCDALKVHSVKYLTKYHICMSFLL